MRQLLRLQQRTPALTTVLGAPVGTARADPVSCSRLPRLRALSVSTLTPRLKEEAYVLLSPWEPLLLTEPGLERSAGIQLLGQAGCWGAVRTEKRAGHPNKGTQIPAGQHRLVDPQETDAV